MSDNRAGRRESGRAFRPTLDGTLETRVLMAASAIRAQTAAGGQAVVITNTDGARFFVSVAEGGTVRATKATGGRVNLFVDGTNAASLLEINRIVPNQVKGSAHTYNGNGGVRNSVLNIASVRVSSGTIGAIEGYQTAKLSGSIVSAGTTRVDRIALSSILPGGSITTGGDLNTLDVYGDVDLDSAAGINIGRDLNSFSTFGNVSVTNDTNFLVGRDLGNSVQPAKGSGPAGQGASILGNLTVEPGSTFTVTRSIPGVVVVQGNLTGLSNFFIGGTQINATTFGRFGVAGTVTA